MNPALRTALCICAVLGLALSGVARAEGEAPPVSPKPSVPRRPPAANPAAADEAALDLPRATRDFVRDGLAALGLDPGAPAAGADGGFTAKTRQAIAAYQRRVDLAPTGYVTSDLLQRLTSDVKSRRVAEAGIRAPDRTPRAPSATAPATQSTPPAPFRAPQFYADERRDFGVAPRDTLQREVGSPTPMTIPGGQLIATQELIRRLNDSAGPRLLLLDALDGGSHRSITGAIRIPLAGHAGDFDDAIQRAVTTQLREVTSGSMDTNLVFFCAGARCWESYNAALRAIHAGYRNVYWFRGGLDAWIAAGQPTGAEAGVPEIAL
jgi:PQQ-dependent catabolism-associated CXXCW motif protein